MMQRLAAHCLKHLSKCVFLVVLINGCILLPSDSWIKEIFYTNFFSLFKMVALNPLEEVKENSSTQEALTLP